MTVIRAVPAVAMLVAGTAAVSCEPLPNVVVRAVPFQLTVAPRDGSRCRSRSA